ncbi:dTDP-4-dehydrorhamnose 3,5-epimerase [Merismopedia glauca]|uniref:dTDP-4-dehydrorhamnose 3,5-epimerase n=1 Tax=Merismopedia glauca CCAP 1448/3 TaxID=1296344 RepID=A0A2T1C4M7_9CYAN|nr:dTDP-4-dehydrorhamnose 3,5-epimerase [Merismopedia glauca]PSB03073.1 dTDP-4-dehydrorhamnose 3,5-epimerase [Merismopedia glauca CCAP 1448/3]
MKIIPTKIPDVWIIEPRVFADNRGFFYESYNHREFTQKIAPDIQFVQDNHSRSGNGVLRGLHYQIQQPQGKLVRVITGSVFDVAVDLRKSSPNFGDWVGVELTAENKQQLWIPPGFAHGFLVTSPVVEVLYKATDYYAPEHERCILWNDPDIGIDWSGIGEPILSAKDQSGQFLREAEVFS